MCFSANASFITGSYLTIIGALCLYKNRHNYAIPFAAIPLLFAAQQLAEGLLWLGLSNHWPSIQTIMPYIFLFFAFFLWPIWVSASLILIEPKKSHRMHLALTEMIGIIVALYLYSHVLLYGVSAQHIDCHIYYELFIGTDCATISTLSYLLATIIPFFLSSLFIMRLFGLILLGSYAISYLFYFTYLVSVWCFFAAILSGLTYIAIIKMNKE